MTVTLTCPECGSGVAVYPSPGATGTECDVCNHHIPLSFDSSLEKGMVEQCPCCQRKDFYQQKDFNRKIGVALFILAAAITPLDLWPEFSRAVVARPFSLSSAR